MSVPFHRSLRAVEADRFGRVALGIGAGAVFLAAWVVWAVAARVAVFARSASARLEVGSQARPVEPGVGGKVVVNRMVLGQEVREGDVLIELDPTAQELELTETRARLAALGPQLAARQRELGAQNEARSSGSQHTPLALAEARARAAEADSAARLARDTLERTRRLSAASLVSAAELVRAETEVERLQSVAEAQRLAVARVEREGQTAASERRGQIDAVEGEIAVIQGQQVVLAATIQRLEHDIGLHVVRAPVAGEIADLALAPPGAQVKEGERLAAIVPTGAVRLVAELAPADAMGRVRPGQRARFRLTGFPWMQYGTLPAVVEHVATEVHEGLVRVELRLEPGAGARAPIEHGLPGTVEIELERVSPATLVLRAAGRLIDAGSGT